MTTNITAIETLIRSAYSALCNGQTIAALNMYGFAETFHIDMDAFRSAWEEASAPLFGGFFTPEQRNPEQGRDWSMITDYISGLYQALTTPVSNGVVTVSITDDDLSQDVVEICHAVESQDFENCIA